MGERKEEIKERFGDKGEKEVESPYQCWKARKNNQCSFFTLWGGIKFSLPVRIFFLRFSVEKSRQSFIGVNGCHSGGREQKESNFLPHVQLFLFCSFRSFKKLRQLDTISCYPTPVSWCPPFSWASLQLNLQASQLFQTLQSTDVETWEESGWLSLHSPSISALCYLLGGRRRQLRPRRADEVITVCQ